MVTALVAGAAAFLHGPQGLFATVETTGTADDDHDDQGQDGVA
ncbi:hypothetical protein ACWC0C_47870 [Streptomyces sp. NPDC001709]